MIKNVSQKQELCSRLVWQLFLLWFGPYDPW